jgi:hypothetical protein
MLTVSVLRMCSIICFYQLGNSRIMVLKLRSSWITVIFLKSQKHTRHIFAKVIRIALILTLHPSWRSVCSSFPIYVWYSTPSSSHFRYPYFLYCRTQQTYICKGYSHCIDPDYASAMAIGTKYVLCKKYHSHSTECYFYV